MSDLTNQVKYHYVEGKTQTQVNLEIPFENIGQDLTKSANKASDASNLFHGSESEKAKQVFVQARVDANRLADEMLKIYNAARPPIAVKPAKQGIASLLTVFLHSEILSPTEGLSLKTGAKDRQGVLFKTGAGDLIRQALNTEGKKVLWYYVKKYNLPSKLGEIGKQIYQSAFGDRGGKNQLDLLSKQIIKQANLSFTRRGSQEWDKDWRYGSETTGYSSVVDLDWYFQNETYIREAALDKNKPYEKVGTTYLSGVKTGKEFNVASHSDSSGKISSPFVIAEIRRLDNEINSLAGKPITDIERKRIAQKVKALQTPRF